MKKALVVLACLLPVFGFSARFVVTTYIPGGTGSLDEAMIKAAQNGDAETDTISFNLPFLQTTIAVNSPLTPSSNLVIDATTQPTKAFGLSDARVRIVTDLCLVAFPFNGQHDVQIYGFWFTGFTYQGQDCISAPISLRNTYNITIGKPGKGNCFTGNRYCIYNPWSGVGDNAENVGLKVQSNRFGIDTNNAPDLNSTLISFGATRNLLFGGDNANEGNKIGNGVVTVGNLYVPLSNAGDSIVFKNNSLGFDAFNGPLNSLIGLQINGFATGKSALNVSVVNNKIGKDDEASKIKIANIAGNIVLRGNYIGSLNTAVTPGDVASAIQISDCLKKDSIVVRGNTVNGYNKGIVVENTLGVTITNNAIYCNKKGICYLNLANVPVIKLNQLTAGYLQGKTKPLSRLEIFTSSVCNNYCENGKVLVATVNADANGIFEYSGTLQTKISLTATAPDGTTSEFYGPKLLLQDFALKNAVCGLKNGFIKGIAILVGTSFRWEDENGATVGTDTALTNVGPGKYRLVVMDSLSSCPVVTSLYTIKNIAKPVVDSAFTITNTSCGKSLGKIVFEGAHPANSSVAWQDGLRHTVQYGGDSIVNIAGGGYYYKVFVSEDSTCYSGFGPLKVVDKAGANLNTSMVQITPSLCNSATGSVRNIVVENAVGSKKFAWQDSTGRIVSTAADLIDQPAGRYRLAMKDETVCDTLFSEYFTIVNKGGINIDSSNRLVTAAGCTVSNGAITGLKVTGADKYEWQNSVSQKVSNQLNLTGVNSGTYTLIVSNSTGCRDTAAGMVVPQATFAPIAVSQVNSTTPHCDLDNGEVSPVFSTDSSRYKFTWTDSVTQTAAGKYARLLNAKAASYFLSATDTNGCQAKLYSITLTQAGKPIIDYSGPLITHDTCNQSQGKIENMLVTGGQSPYTWAWFKDNSTSVYAQTANGLSKLSKGSYKAAVADAFGCDVSSRTFAIGDFQKQLTTPKANDVSVARNTAADLVITNYKPGSYTLFDTAIAALPVRISSGSHLLTPKVTYDKTFYIQYSLGNCTSSLSPVLVKVYDKASVSLPNAFSPNGDGINDVWKMNKQGLITVKEWLVFNRYGQLVVSVKNAEQGWDGTVNGKTVSAGTYYYVFSAVDNEGRITAFNGSVSVLR